MVQITMLIFNISLLIGKNAIDGAAQRKVYQRKNLAGAFRRGNLRWSSRNFRDYGMPAFASWRPKDRGVGPSQSIQPVYTPAPEITKRPIIEIQAFSSGNGGGSSFFKKIQSQGANNHLSGLNSHPLHPKDMEAVVEGMLNKYDGTKPVLIGIPYPVVYEVPMQDHLAPPAPRRHHPIQVEHYDIKPQDYTYDYNPQPIQSPTYQTMGMQPHFKSAASAPAALVSGTAAQAGNEEMVQYNNAEDPFDTYQK